MPLYAVRTWRGEPVAREHDALAWALPAELSRYPMPPADEPLVAFLTGARQ
jgi:8-oxo-dGTP diphosphatase